jgi:hypothetical protein
VNLSIHTALAVLVTSSLREPIASARTCGITEDGLDGLRERITVADDKPDLTTAGMAIRAAGAAAEPGFGLVQGELVEAGALESLCEVVVVGIGGCAVQAAAPRHELVGVGVVILDAVNGLIEPGAAFVGGVSDREFSPALAWLGATAWRDDARVRRASRDRVSLDV